MAVSLALIEAADVATLAPEEQAAALAKGTADIHALIEHAVCPVIMGQVGKSDAERAIAATYYRIALLMRGLTSLSDPAHFQVANTTARTVFELVLDMKSLCEDRSLAAKFFAFTRVIKFRKAGQLVRFLDRNPNIDRSPHQYATSFASDPQRRHEVEQQCILYWGTGKNGQPNWPDHWTGRSIADRSHEAGPAYEEIYRSQFFLQSQYVHASPAGIQDLSREALACSFGIAHRLVQQLAARATEIVANEFRLFDTNLELRHKLQVASAASGFYAVEAALRVQQEVAMHQAELISQV